MVCGAPSMRCVPLCSDCESEWLVFPDSMDGRCLCCGRLLISALERCIDCRTVSPLQKIDRVYPLFPYDRMAQELLAAWKIGGCFGLTGLFARYMAIKLADFPGIPVIPVPPRPGKIREKGWDQIEQLARILEREYRVPVLRCLRRSSSVQQKKLGREARGINLKGCITLKKDFRIPEKAIVIDDIMTTGATLDSCAAVLKEGGVSCVYGLTIFYD